MVRRKVAVLAVLLTATALTGEVCRVGGVGRFSKAAKARWRAFAKAEPEKYAREQRYLLRRRLQVIPCGPLTLELPTLEGWLGMEEVEELVLPSGDWPLVGTAMREQAEPVESSESGEEIGGGYVFLGGGWVGGGLNGGGAGSYSGPPSPGSPGGTGVDTGNPPVGPETGGASVPEPSTVILVLSGMGLIGWRKVR